MNSFRSLYVDTENVVDCFVFVDGSKFQYHYVENTIVKIF